MATKLMVEQWKARSPDWRGMLRRRFRWSRLRFEFGRWCHIVHPVEGGADLSWWEWETP